MMMVIPSIHQATVMAVLIAACSTSFCTVTEAFQMKMAAADYNYKPPVKSSVKKLHSRNPSSTSASGSTNAGYNYSSRARTSSKSAYAGAALLEPQRRRQSFEQRMRNLVVGTAAAAQQQTRKLSSPPRSTSTIKLPDNVRIIESLKDYKIIVGDEREKIVAVRFYATYCRACKAVAPHFYHLAKQYPNVAFVDVPVSDKNAVLHKGLGIPCLPYSHIYHPEFGLVEEHKLTRKDIATFKQKLDSYVTAGS